MSKPLIAICDTKPCDREYPSQAAGAENLEFLLDEFRLEPSTAYSAEGAASSIGVFPLPAIEFFPTPAMIGRHGF